jgi:redox-sensitive bicupin YhaK (pirin superfamily)
LPEFPQESTDVLIYLFAGEISIEGSDKLRPGESLLVGNTQLRLIAHETSDVILFVTNSASTYTANGMYSGNINR